MAERRTQGFLDEVLAVVPPLAPEEVEWYRWLIDGLLHGVERLIASEAPAAAVVALDEARDLVAELVARIHPEDVRS